MHNESFNWVEERSKCSLAKVFQQLRAEIQSDVEDRNSIRGETPYYEFSVISAKPQEFTVFLSGNAVNQHVVAFGTVGNEIVAVGNGNQEISRVSLTLNNDGQCRLKTPKGEELEFWQFRRLALEKLFFQSVPREVF